MNQRFRKPMVPPQQRKQKAPKQEAPKSKPKIDPEAKQREKARKQEEQRLKVLERAKQTILDSVFMQTKSKDNATKEAQANIRKAVATSKTTQELRRQVNLQKANLKVIKKQSFVMERMKNSSQQMVGNMASAFAIAATGTFITKTGQDFEAVNNTMLAVSENSTEAGENMKFVQNEAYRLGLGLKESAKGFAKMAAARGDMSLENTKELFLGVSEMGTLLGLSAAEAGRAINSVQQMASKGVVSAEELSYCF